MAGLVPAVYVRPHKSKEFNGTDVALQRLTCELFELCIQAECYCLAQMP